MPEEKDDSKAKVKELDVAAVDEKALKEAAGDYEPTDEQKKELGEDAGVEEKAIEEKLEDLKEVSAFVQVGTVFEGETKEHRLPNNEVVRSIKYTYKPMTDIQRAKYSEKIRRTQSIEKVRSLTYVALTRHVISLEIEGFDPAKVLAWSSIRPTDVIEEIMDAITGQITMSEGDLKNW